MNVRQIAVVFMLVLCMMGCAPISTRRDRSEEWKALDDSVRGIVMDEAVEEARMLEDIRERPL